MLMKTFLLQADDFLFPEILVRSADSAERFLRDVMAMIGELICGSALFLGLLVRLPLGPTSIDDGPGSWIVLVDLWSIIKSARDFSREYVR